MVVMDMETVELITPATQTVNTDLVYMATQDMGVMNTASTRPERI